MGNAVIITIVIVIIVIDIVIITVIVIIGNVLFAAMLFERSAFNNVDSAFGNLPSIHLSVWSVQASNQCRLV